MERTPSGRVWVYHVASGCRVERTPEEARRLVSLGGYSLTAGEFVAPDPVAPDPFDPVKPEPVAPPAPAVPDRPDDPEAMPDGYTREHVAGGYFRLYDPEDNEIPGPSRGRHQGRDGAADGAWKHLYKSLLEGAE